MNKIEKRSKTWERHPKMADFLIKHSPKSKQKALLKQKK